MKETSNENLNIILLAAGLSRRMGEANKMLLPCGGSTILETTLQNLLAADIGNITVVVGYEADRIKKILENNPLFAFGRNPLDSIVENKAYEKGMTSSIQTALSALDDKPFMVCLADMPTILPEEYRLIAHTFFEKLIASPHLILKPLFKNQMGNPTVFASVYRVEMLRLPFSESPNRAIIQKHKQHLQTLEMETPHILQDIDAPADLAVFSGY
jgi:molybdenum cofactor cytidylyltransferase